MKSFYGIVIVLMSLFVFITCQSQSQASQEQVDMKTLSITVLDLALVKYSRSALRMDPADGYARNIPEGIQWSTTGPGGWTSGFYPGILWYLYQYGGSDSLHMMARRWTIGLEAQKTADTHDIGFMVNNSFGHGYRIGKIDAYKQTTLDAAAHLASRFNPVVGAIKSWDWSDQWKYPVIIDNMMNLELLFWAANNGGQAELKNIALTHAETTIREHVRPDGSTFHVVVFDPETGEVEQKRTHQGFADSSTWARGQAWGIYGFTMTYRETKQEKFLQTAEKLARYFIDHLPKDYVPYWDFQAPDIPNAPRDASAGAIAACGMLELARHTGNQIYRKTAESILRILASDNYLVQNVDYPALLLHSTGNLPGNSEIDMPIIYADYYFVEAMLKIHSE
jgi:unsaturated chondroitin disaccharide hydrolase